MSISNEKVKLDEVLKFSFSTSKKVLVNLLNDPEVERKGIEKGLKEAILD